MLAYLPEEQLGSAGLIAIPCILGHISQVVFIFVFVAVDPLWAYGSQCLHVAVIVPRHSRTTVVHNHRIYATQGFLHARAFICPEGRGVMSGNTTGRVCWSPWDDVTLKLLGEAGSISCDSVS